MEISNINQVFTGNSAPAKAMNQIVSPYGSDVVSISADKPEKLISPADYSKLFKPESTRVQWSYKWGEENRFSSKGAMISKDGSVYTAARGLIRRLNPEDGSIIWEKDMGKDSSGITSSPAIEGKDGKILVSTGDKNLHALDPETGKEMWQFRTDSYSYYNETPIAPDGTIFVRDKRDMVALNPDGEVKYRFPIEDDGHQVRYMENDGTAYIESNRGIFAINPDGSEKWHIPGNNVERFPADPDRIYTLHDKWSAHPSGVNIFQNSIVARDPETGEKLWERMFGESQNPEEVKQRSMFILPGNEKLFSGAQIFGAHRGKLFVKESGKIHCLEAATGKSLWDKEYEKTPAIKLIGDDGTLYVYGKNGLEALNPDSGELKWEAKSISSGINNIPAVITDNGMMMIVDGKTLQGISLKDGLAQFKRNMDGGIRDLIPSPDLKSLVIEQSDAPNFHRVDIRTAAEMAKAMKEESPGKTQDPGKITVEKNFVEIGGVRIPRRKGD